MRGTHQGQQSARTAPTGRTHDCKRHLHHAPHDLLHGGGHPHMRRRDFLALLGGIGVWWPVGTHAQQKAMIPRIGYLSPGAPTDGMVDGFREGLKELGYVEGQNIEIEYRWGLGTFDRIGEYAKALVQLNVDVIVAVVTQASLAAQAASATIPIVMVAVADPVGVGLVASLARPGSNITGTSGMSAEIVGKQFQFLKEVVPQDTRVAVFWNPANAAFQALQLSQVEIAARASGVQLQLLARISHIGLVFGRQQGAEWSGA